VFVVVLLLLNIHEDASISSLATATVAVADEFGCTTLCAMATKVTLILVITYRGALTTVVTMKMSQSRVGQVCRLLQQLNTSVHRASSYEHLCLPEN